LGVVIIALSILFIPFIIESFFSPAYFNAADVITLLLFSNVFKSLGFAMNFVIIKKQKQKYSVIYFSLGLIVIILLNYFCIPYFGIKGAGLVSIIGQVLTNLVFPLLFLDKDINLEIKNIMISFVKAPLFIVKDIKAVIKL
ncbi:hypothetical protein CUP71_005287, partial [Escherichia coli]|nr:hypothetical protein [Escherichia coli]